MPTLHSHTITHRLDIFKGVREPQAVCQVAQANAHTKTWQRVCLPHRTKESETHDRQEGQQLTYKD